MKRFEGSNLFGELQVGSISDSFVAMHVRSVIRHLGVSVGAIARVWALVVRVSGGFTVELLDVQVRSHNQLRPIIVAALEWLTYLAMGGRLPWPPACTWAGGPRSWPRPRRWSARQGPGRPGPLPGAALRGRRRRPLRGGGGSSCCRAPFTYDREKRQPPAKLAGSGACRVPARPYYGGRRHQRWPNHSRITPINQVDPATAAARDGCDPIKVAGSRPWS